MSLFLGIDAGSSYIKVVWLSGNGDIAKMELFPTTAGYEDAVSRMLEGVSSSVVTGYCRRRISRLFGIKSISEIKAHALGAYRLCPDARFVIDVGGQDSKVIRLNGDGAFSDFVMNDRCAAGTGRFLEVVSQRLGVSVDRLSELAERCRKPATISSMCVVFAESEIVSLLAQGEPVESIAYAVIDAVATRIASMAKGFGVESKVVFTGGGALCSFLVKRVSEKLGLPIKVPPHPQFAGAIGAALEASLVLSS